MQVQRYIPPPQHPLSPYLLSIWRGRASGTFRTETLLPKGTVDIIFNLAEPSRLVAGRRVVESVNLGSCFMHGVQTTAVQTRHGNKFDLLGISLTMEGGAVILPLPASELTDVFTEPGLIFDDVSIILERLSDMTNFQKQVQLLLHWLMRLVQPPPRHKIVRYACVRLRRMPTEANLRDIARSLQVSERHFRRLFLEQVGVSPSFYLRLSRFVQAIYTIPSSSHSLTEIAHAMNYTDQAHFCRDFKVFAGLTPKKYRDRVDVVPGHIFSE